MKLAHIPARTGITWFRLGLRTFWRQPIALTSLFLLFLTILQLLSMVPWIGLVLVLGLLPTMTLGLMAATREADMGRFPMPTTLFIALRSGRQQMWAMGILGACCVGGFLLILSLSSLIDDGQFARSLLLGYATPEQRQMPAFQKAMLLVMTFNLPWSMLFWHAPALVHWHGISPIKSLFFGVVACARHIGALIVYILAWLSLTLGLVIILSLLEALPGIGDIMALIALPMALLASAMFASSVWFTFRDSFVADDETPTLPTETTA